MIVHNYTDASDNLAQYEADQLDRQEVTVDWYLDNMIDACLFRWTGDEDAELGLDPWRFHMDLPIEPEDAKERGWRIFVQRKDMPAEERTEKKFVGTIDCTPTWKGILPTLLVGLADGSAEAQKIARGELQRMADLYVASQRRPTDAELEDAAYWNHAAKVAP